MKILETNRLILRPFEPTDLDDLYEYAKSENVGPNAGWPPHENKDETLKILNSFIEGNKVRAIVYKENNKVIGSIGVHKDHKREIESCKMIGYVLSEDYWGKGIMAEGVKAVIKHLFEEENLEVVSCYHYPFNTKSKRVIEKCGFVYEGTIRCSSEIYNGNIYDDVCYSITKNDYFTNLKNKIW